VAESIKRSLVAQGVPADKIQDQLTGLLAPPRDPDALGKALLRLIEQPDLAKEMARAGRERVVARPSIAACSKARTSSDPQEVARL